MAFFLIFFLTWSRTGFLRYPSKTAREMAQNPDGSFHRTVITAGLRSRAQEELEDLGWFRLLFYCLLAFTCIVTLPASESSGLWLKGAV